MDNDKFFELYNELMCADLRYDQRQVLYFAAKMRYQGAKYQNGKNGIERIKPENFKNVKDD
jgi:hypothetical protein